MACKVNIREIVDEKVTRSIDVPMKYCHPNFDIVATSKTGDKLQQILDIAATLQWCRN